MTDGRARVTRVTRVRPSVTVKVSIYFPGQHGSFSIVGTADLYTSRARWVTHPRAGHPKSAWSLLRARCRFHAIMATFRLWKPTKSYVNFKIRSVKTLSKPSWRVFDCGQCTTLHTHRNGISERETKQMLHLYSEHQHGVTVIRSAKTNAARDALVP